MPSMFRGMNTHNMLTAIVSILYLYNVKTIKTSVIFALRKNVLTSFSYNKIKVRMKCTPVSLQTADVSADQSE